MSFRTLSGMRKPDATTEPEPYAAMILGALQYRPVYLGTVDPAEVLRRRRRNRAARATRKKNRRIRRG